MNVRERLKQLADEGNVGEIRHQLSEMKYNDLREADSLLARAVSDGDIGVARALLEAGLKPDDSQYIKSRAVARGDRAMVRMLMEHGVNFFEIGGYLSGDYLPKLQMILAANQTEDIVRALRELKEEVALITRPQELDKPVPAFRVDPAKGSKPPTN